MQTLGVSYIPRMNAFALILVQAPFTDFLPRVSKSPESMFIKTFIPEFSVKALDVTILHWLSGLDHLQLNATIVRHLILRPLAKEFMTKSLDHACFGTSGSTAG